MAVTTHSLGNLHKVIYGSTTVTDNTATITDVDFGLTIEAICLNPTPLTLTVAPDATLAGVLGGSIVLNQGEFCKIFAPSPKEWRFAYRSPVTIRNASTTDTISKAALNAKYAILNVPVGSMVSYYRQNREFVRVKDTDWTVKDTTILS